MYTAVIADGVVVSIEDNDGLDTMRAIVGWRFGRPKRVMRVLVCVREYMWYSSGYALGWDCEGCCVEKLDIVI